MDSSSTSSSEPRRRPKAALLAFALVLAGEAGIKATLPIDQGRHIQDDVLASIEKGVEHRSVVFWSDSVTAGAIHGGGGDDLVAKLGSTQAISMAGVYYTYRRWVRAAGAPKVLVICVMPESYGNDLDQIYTPSYFESVFLDPGEILDFVRTTGRFGLGARMAMNSAFLPPSMKRRGEVRRTLRELRSPGGPGIAAAPLNRIAGMDPWVKDGLALREKHERFRMSSIAATYLDRLAEETRATGTRLVLMTSALPAPVVRAWDLSGYMGQYREMLEGLRARFPHVELEPTEQFADYPLIEMYDPEHLRPAVAEKYGVKVVDRLRVLEKGPICPTRK